MILVYVTFYSPTKFQEFFTTLTEAQNKRAFGAYTDIAVAQCKSILFIEGNCQIRNDRQDQNFDPKKVDFKSRF